MGKEFEKIDNVKKINDARNDIEKINRTIRSEYSIQQKANDLYKKLIQNVDYAKYIIDLRRARKMFGDIPFERLNEDAKKDVLIMVRDAIQLFIDKLEIDNANKNKKEES